MLHSYIDEEVKKKKICIFEDVKIMQERERMDFTQNGQKQTRKTKIEME